MNISIFQLTQKEFVEAMYARFGKGRQQAELLYRLFFRFGRFPEKKEWVEQQSYELAQEMMEVTDIALPEVSLHRQEGEIVKFLLRFPDGLESESVGIPMEAGLTLCLSSQVGCKMGCAFCETGKMGLLRHLKAEEIVQQAAVARFQFDMPVRNLVFMGMGEPFDNFDAVMQAIRVLTDPSGFGIGPSRITVSTSGRVDGLERWTKEADPALNLAVSINAPTDEIRRRIMPVNRQWGLAELKGAMMAYCAHPRREILIEYVLLKGINDSLECADLLAAYLSDLRVKVNLIPYNPQTRDRFSPPDEEVMELFLARLRDQGYQTLIRHPKGQGIMAACGQLGNKRHHRLKLALS